MKPMGIMALVVPASFLADDFSDGSLIKEMESISVSSVNLCWIRICFLPLAYTDMNKGSVLAAEQRGGWMDLTPLFTEMTIDAVSLNSAGVDMVKRMCLDEAQELFRKNRSHILLELSQQRDMSGNFMYQVKKYLYAIKLILSLKKSM